MGVLCELASRAGETVTREELLAAVWPARVVVEETLTRAVSQLRNALADTTSQPRYIQTVPKKGYRMIAEVEVVTHSHPQVASPTPDQWTEPDSEERATASIETSKIVGKRGVSGWQGMAWAAGVFLVSVMLYSTIEDQRQETNEVPAAPSTLVRPPSIAVLPFRNLSADAESDYFAQGIAEELLSTLAGVAGIRVPSHRSSFAFRNRDETLNVIASSLDVEHVLEGSVQRSEDTLRISTQLIDVSTDTAVWSQQYDSQLNELFSVQQQMATEVLAALQSTVLSKPAGVTDQNVPHNLRNNLTYQTESGSQTLRSTNLDAYRHYLQGQFWRMNGDTSDWHHKARSSFEKAIELDPEFADAYASLAYMYARFDFFDNNMPADVAVPEAQRAITQALRLDARAVEAYLARAILSNRQGNFAAAKSDLDQAIALKPNGSIAQFLYSEVFLAEGQPEQAISRATAALKLDPLSQWVNVNMAIVRFANGQRDQALSAIRRAIDINPSYSWAYVWQAIIEHAAGNFAAAIKAMHKCLLIDADSTVNSAYLGLLYLEVEEKDLAAQWFRKSAKLHGDNSSARFWQQFVSLVRDQRNPRILLELVESMPQIEATTYSLVPSIHAATITVSSDFDLVALLRQKHPELWRQQDPTVNMANAPTAIALIGVLRDAGQTERANALVDAGLVAAETYSTVFAERAYTHQFLALSGQRERALQLLQQQAEKGALEFWWALPQFPALSSLRNDPRFKATLAEMSDHAANQRRLLSTH
ncbi:MAG: winged helix-turn-helix domain-containing protein [Pseudomonadota bacterium]